MTFYGTVADADAYHLARGNDAWDQSSVTNEAKEEALLRASDYIDYTFRRSFPGWKAGEREQIREWPREWAVDIEGNAIDSDEVPIEVERATYEAAFRELESPGSLLPDLDNPGQQAIRQKVGPIEVEYTGPTGIDSVKPIISIIGGIIAPVLTGIAHTKSAGSTIRV